VLADVTYATETAYSSNAAKEKLDAVKNAQKPPLRALILGGDFYTATVLAATLTKLVLRFAGQGKDPQAVNALRAEVRPKLACVLPKPASDAADFNANVLECRPCSS
jgi:coatomer subunit beta